MNNLSDHLTLVLGATGKTGSRVAQKLSAQAFPSAPQRVAARTSDSTGATHQPSPVL
jgi:uncharacterized protein YbjT (DUF2867 family)